MKDSTHTDRIWGLDLLRTLAVLSVVLYHYPRSETQLWLRALSHYGWTGVDLFFVLSGYLIAGQLFQRVKNQQKLEIFSFYARRFFRTLPNYYAILGVTALVSGGLSWKYLFFLQNFGVPEQFSHSWSLCVEEHFYLFFPLFVFLALREAISARTMLIFVFIGGIVLRFLIWRSWRPDLIYLVDIDKAFATYLGHIFYPTYIRLDGLTVGVGLAALRVFRPQTWQQWTSRAHLTLGLGICFLASAAIVLHWRMSALGTVFGYPLLAFGYGALLLSAVSPRCWLTIVKIPGISFVALLSYAIYLTHGFALQLASIATQKLHASPYGLVMFFCSLLCVPACAALLYYGIETPFMRLRDRFVPTK